MIGDLSEVRKIFSQKADKMLFVESAVEDDSRCKSNHKARMWYVLHLTDLDIFNKTIEDLENEFKQLFGFEYEY